MAESTVLRPYGRRHAADHVVDRDSGDPAALSAGTRGNRAGQYRVRPDLSRAAQSAGRCHSPGHRDRRRRRDCGRIGHLIRVGVAPPRRRRDIVPARTAADLGNDQEAGASPRLVDDRLLDLAPSAGPAWIDIDLDQEGRGTAIHQRGAQQEPVGKPALQRSSHW